MNMHLVRAARLGLLALLAACGSNAPRATAPGPTPPSPAPPLEITTLPDATAAEKESEALVAQSAPTETPAKTPAEPKPALEKGSPLGSVAGVPIFAEDLLLEWHQIAGREVTLVIEKVVTTRLAIAEAQRLGLRLAPEAVELRVGIEHGRLKENVEGRGLGLSVEEYVRTELGVDPERYFARMRAATIRQMLAERVVRAWTLSNENVALRLIVTKDPDSMLAVQELLADGADFGDVAREHSVDDTASLGGLVPYLVRQEHSPLARLAFGTAVGEIGGPVAMADHLFLIRVEERRGQLAGDWTSTGAAVEASLEEFGLSDAEFVHWKIAMEARYPIDLRRLEEILGSQG